MAVLCLMQLDSSSSPRIPWFNSKDVRGGICTGQSAMEEVFSSTSIFPC